MCVTLFNETRRTPIANRIDIADTSLRRIIGLIGRRHLSLEEGLWIKPSSGVHTFGMSFIIDVIGLGRSHRVVRLWRDLNPCRLTSISWQVRSVIELRAGSINDNGIQLGDILSLAPSLPRAGDAL